MLANCKTWLCHKMHSGFLRRWAIYTYKFKRTSSEPCTNVWCTSDAILQIIFIASFRCCLLSAMPALPHTHTHKAACNNNLSHTRNMGHAKRKSMRPCTRGSHMMQHWIEKSRWRCTLTLSVCTRKRRLRPKKKKRIFRKENPTNIMPGNIVTIKYNLHLFYYHKFCAFPSPSPFSAAAAAAHTHTYSEW